MKMYEELLNLARKTIKAYFNGSRFEIEKDIIKKYSNKQACFVTLKELGELRGCIGCLEPHQELYKDVMDNSINAAFRDPRFPSLKEEELEKIKIEVSVLSIPKKLIFKDIEDLLKKIDNNMGIILKSGLYEATFLPQVWEDIPDKIEFLQHLSLKAGLSRDGWKNASFEYYSVEKVEEE